MEARRHAELDADAEWGLQRWEGAVHVASDPRAGEGRDVRAGVVPAVLRPCAGERWQRKGIGRRRWERASRA
jgi:hypothetical protein